MRRFSLAILLLTIAASPAPVAGQTSDEELIPSSALAAIFARPQDAFQQPSLELFPREIVTAAGKENLGIDPMEIVSATVLIDRFENLEDPPGFALILRFGSPQALSENLLRGMNAGELDGKTVYRTDDETAPVVYMPDDRTLMLGMEPFIGKMLAARGEPGELRSLIEKNRARASAHLRGFFVVEPVRGLIRENLPPAEQVPPPFQEFRELPNLVHHVVFEVDFAGDTRWELAIGATDDAAAERMVAILRDGFRFGRGMLMGMVAQQMQEESPEMQAAVQQYADRLATYLETTLIPPAEGAQIVYQGEGQGGLTSLSTAGVLAALVLPAVQSAREAARRASARNNLRQIALAVLNYHDAYQRFPGNITAEDGTPLLSWRVAILPFMEEEGLYRQFHLDEPWDSEHNLQLLPLMPQLYRSPNVELTDRTVFLGFDGPGTLFEGRKLRIADIVDGTSNTLLCVEADAVEAIAWSRPADLPFDPAEPLRGVGHLRPAGFNSVLCDGSVRFISNSIDPQTLIWLILRNDGNAIPDFE